VPLTKGDDGDPSRKKRRKRRKTRDSLPWRTYRLSWSIGSHLGKPTSGLPVNRPQSQWVMSRAAFRQWPPTRRFRVPLLKDAVLHARISIGETGLLPRTSLSSADGEHLPVSGLI